MSSSKFGVALLGCGTVGGGVYELLKHQIGDIESKYGFQFDVKKVLVRNPNKQRSGIKVDEGVITTNFDEIIKDSTIDVIIEVMGGESPAREYLSEALRANKNVITANKALMGSFGEKLIEKARQQGRFFGFSAAVTGFHHFVPSIVKSIMITELIGIFNGTTNYILSKLSENSFDEALSQAISLGYAEADHHNDTGGFDTRNKLVIATKLAFGLFLDRADIPVSGIIGITKKDMEYAAHLGYTIKLVGVSKITEPGKVSAYVAPALLPQDDPLALVHGVNNGILVYDKFRGVQGMSAAGAGRDATAMAIFSDLVGMARGENTLWPDPSRSRNLTFTRNQVPTPWYVRVDVENKPGVMAKITKDFSRNQLNITAANQKEGSAPITSIVFMLGPSKPKNVQKALDDLVQAKIVLEPPVMLRVERSPKVGRTAEQPEISCGELVGA